MKRIINVTLIVLFCAAAFVFNFAGSRIRDIVAPRVRTAPIQQTRMGDIVPEEAVRYNEEAEESYIYVAIPSEKYPERGMEVRYVKCLTDTAVDEGMIVYIYDIKTYDASVIVSSDKEIFDGQRVIIDNN